MAENLTGKLSATQYYVHNSYVNVYYYVYKFLENWIAENIFRNDSSRVFLASDGYAFRRRFELTDTSKNYDDLEFSSLRLPFANYFPQNNGWVPDDRLAGKNAPLAYLGIYEGDTKIRATSSTMNIPVTFWFDREDDARLAYEILYFKSFNEIYNSTKVPYGRNNTLQNDNLSHSSSILELPVNFKIESLQFNPSFTETDWLKRQRVFPIKVSFKVRTFAILPPKQPNYDIMVNANGVLDDGSAYEDGYSYYYIVDRVILNWTNENYTMQTYDAGYDPSLPMDLAFRGPVRFPDKGRKNTFYVDSYKADENDHSENKIYIWDEINNRYILPDYDLDCASLTHFGTYIESQLNITKFDCITKVEETENTISWEYGDDDTKDSITTIELHLINLVDIVTVDPAVNSVTLKDLTPNTQYIGYALFKTADDGYKKIQINFTTKGTTIEKVGKLNSIVGISW
jgi:hypothetical protein